jgi:hypothetical protein
MLHLENSFLWCWELDNSDSGSEMPVKFLNVMLGKDGEDHLDLSLEKWRSNMESQEEEECYSYMYKEKKVGYTDKPRIT